nr:MAG TPA: portal protein [Caudoviricetes sp.]
MGTENHKPTPPVRFADLTKAQRRTVASRIVSTLRRTGYLARAKYNPVAGRDQSLRARLYAERGGEETAVSTDERNRLIALARDMARNGETMSALLRQFDFNAIGTVGGKANFALGDGYANESAVLRETFASWASSCEFFDGEDFQHVLRMAMRSKLLSGRAGLIFDDGIVRDSGKVILFEGDCVANVRDEDFAALFPSGWSQHQGIIKDEVGVTRGCFVSFSQRGERVFNLRARDGKLAVWSLVRGESQEWRDAPFTLFSHAWRINQTVAVPSVHASLGSMIDLEDLTKYEIQAAKKNAQTIATLTGPAPESAATALAAAGLDNDRIFDNPDTAEGAAADAAAEAADETETVELDHIEGANVIYDILPPDAKLELLDTKHPNANMAEFVRWVAGRVGWSNGVGSVYATGKADASYTAFRGEQVMSWPAFENEQHLLESKICDWVLRRWFAWATRKGLLPALNLPDGWMRRVDWKWPSMREVNRVDTANADSVEMRNCTSSLREKLGADWKERLLLLKEELAFCRENGIPHPALQTVSGQIIADSSAQAQKDQP